MNKERREQLAKAATMLNEVKELFASIKEEEEGAHGDLPENLQNSEKGEEMSANVSCLEEAISYIESAEGELEGIV